MFGWGKKERDLKGPKALESAEQSYGMPTVKFDPARVTEFVKADLRQNIKSLKEIGPEDFDTVYNAALSALSVGMNMPPLYQVLIAIDGISKKHAKEITRALCSKAQTLIQTEQWEQLGIKYAIWRYSGAPCEINPRKSTDKELQQNEAHKAANEKIFSVSKGMFLDGKWTRPGYEEGCKCVASPMIPGLDGYDGGKPEGFVE